MSEGVALGAGFKLGVAAEFGVAAATTLAEGLGEGGGEVDADGLGVGAGVGEADALALGEGDALGDVEALGLGEVLGEGDALGLADALGEGEALGLAEALADGDGVGAGVALGVGECPGSELPPMGLCLATSARVCVALSTMRTVETPPAITRLVGFSSPLVTWPPCLTITSSIILVAAGASGLNKSFFNSVELFIVLATSKSTVCQSFIDLELVGAISI